MSEETKSNGAAAAPERWIVALMCGTRFVGRVVQGPDGQLGMSPVFELQVSAVQQGNGQAIVHVAAPVLGLESLRALPVAQGSIIFGLEELDEKDRESIGRAIAIGVKMASQMRAAKSGLMVVPAGVKLPPMPPPKAS